MAVFGRDMGLTSYEVAKIFRSLKNGNSEYSDKYVLCDRSGCRSGRLINPFDEKDEKACDKCMGYGFYRK